MRADLLGIYDCDENKYEYIFENDSPKFVRSLLLHCHYRLEKALYQSELYFPFDASDVEVKSDFLVIHRPTSPFMGLIHVRNTLYPDKWKVVVKSDSPRNLLEILKDLDFPSIDQAEEYMERREMNLDLFAQSVGESPKLL